MAITTSNLHTESFNIIKNFISDNLTDPRYRFKKNWVHTGIPDINSKGFDGYPFWVIQINLNEEEKSFDRSTSQKVFRALCTVYSKEATEVDTLADEFLSKFKDETLTNSLSEFKSIEVESSEFTTNQDFNGQKIYSRAIGIIGRKRL